MHFLAHYILRGKLQAMGVASGLVIASLLMLPFSMFVGFISSAAIALVTLRKGFQEGGVTLLGAALAAALIGALWPGNFQFMLAYSLLLWLPVWLIAVVLRETRQLALALEGAALLGGIMVLLIYLVSEDPAALWHENLQRSVGLLAKQSAPELDMAQIDEGLAFIAHYMSGIVVAGSVFSMIASLLLARWWQSILYNPGGFRAEFLTLRMHPVSAYLSLTLILMALLLEGLVSEIAWNVIAVAFLLYLIAGTAVLHCIFSTTKAKRFWLTGLYMLMFFIPHVLLPVALLGFTDTWLNWRRSAQVG